MAKIIDPLEPNSSNTPDALAALEYVEQLKADLQQAKNDAAEARREADEAKAQLKSATPQNVTGEYKGYRFVPGQTRVRDAEGRLCDAQQVMDAANTGDAEACAILDRLIDMGYALLVKAE